MLVVGVCPRKCCGIQQYAKKIDCSIMKYNLTCIICIIQTWSIKKHLNKQLYFHNDLSLCTYILLLLSIHLIVVCTFSLTVREDTALVLFVMDD